MGAKKGEISMKRKADAWNGFLRSILGNSAAVEDLRAFFSNDILLEQNRLFHARQHKPADVPA